METLEQVRDEIAGMMGYNHAERSRLIDFPHWRKDGDAYRDEEGNPSHPIPTTLDGIAAMMPEGWHVTIEQLAAREWRVRARLRDGVNYEVGPRVMLHAPTELEARTRLLHSVITATKGATHEK